MRDYAAFLESKRRMVEPHGFAVPPSALHPSLFPFQRDLTAWALRTGRAAIFADTGLGKSRIQIEWARQIHIATERDVLILAPLAVTFQTMREGAAVSVPVTHCRDGADCQPGINITNYDRLHRFDPARFVGVVLDESSCIKHHDSRRLADMMTAFAGTPYRLCATATPAPNDFVELGTHAELLGVATQTEMMSEYFVHDSGETQTWRLKRHARALFWRWVASWAALVRHPADLGYDDARYTLPKLNVENHIILSDARTLAEMGLLFAKPACDLRERRRARAASVDGRVRRVAEIVNADRHQWLVWGDLNAETSAVAKAIKGAVEVRGPDDADDKERRLIDFAAGKIRVLVTKPSIAGWGMNFQRCSHMAFVGISDSFESQYQAIRRCWRFGQTQPVHVHRFLSDAERSVLENIERKEADAATMAAELAITTRAAIQESIQGVPRD